MKEKLKTFGMCTLALCVLFIGPIIAGLIERWVL